jgi:hypothetical protein
MLDSGLDSRLDLRIRRHPRNLALVGHAPIRCQAIDNSEEHLGQER